MKKKIVIMSGDPNSINSEIILKTWHKLNNDLKKRIYIISNYKLLQSQFKKMNKFIKIIKLKDINEKLITNKLKVIDLNINFKNPFNVKFKSNSKFIMKSLNMIHELAQRDDVQGIVNCPLDKRLLNKNNIGVTEFLAKKCGKKNNSVVMLIKNKKLSVSPITTHLKLKNVSKSLKTSTIIKKIRLIDNWYKEKLKKKPIIGVLGLNPHNAELKKNSEEKKIIIPAIKKLKMEKINLEGPLVADTVFINDYKNYDVIVGMYHDQVLAPFKTMFKFDAINLTIGLDYLRVSPDHGIAKNLIGKNKANYISLMNCINFVRKFGR